MLLLCFSSQDDLPGSSRETLFLQQTFLIFWKLFKFSYHFGIYISPFLCAILSCTWSYKHRFVLDVGFSVFVLFLLLNFTFASYPKSCRLNRIFLKFSAILSCFPGKLNAHHYWGAFLHLPRVLTQSRVLGITTTLHPLSSVRIGSAEIPSR